MKGSVEILFKDAHMLAANKPAGLLSVPDGYDPKIPFLTGILEAEFGQLWTVHRLDGDTSGIVLLARTAEAHRALNTQFEQREVEKVYHALIAGSPPWEELYSTRPLLPDGDRRHRTLVDPKAGKPSATRLRVLERFRGYSLLEARPETGRTHQIRVHLAAEGYPIAGDTLYGSGEGVFLSRAKPGYKAGRGEEERPLVGRLALHARTLSFNHPESGERLVVEAPYPKDMAAAVRQLAKIQ